jgi:enoyl-CoA hydratase
LVNQATVDGIATITLDNPSLNLMNPAMRSALQTAVDSIRADSEIRVVILRGKEQRAFSAGSDLNNFSVDREESRDGSHREHALFDSIEDLPQPTIAALEGYVLGGGLELALTCDFRIAGGDALFGFPEVTLGVFAASGGTQRLPRLIGASRAKEMLLLGETVDAAKAESVGLVWRVVPAGRAYAEAMELARKLAALPNLAIRAAKQAINLGLREGVVAGSALEEQLIADLHLSHDGQEGVAAFLQKRKPNFKHS